MLKVASWNVNSIRSRLERLEEFIQDVDIDILCLQEIKATEDQFPYESIERMGFVSHIRGQKTYNGVGLLAKKDLKLKDICTDMSFAEGAHEARYISAMVGKLRIINIYAPNGNSVGHAKYDYKLRWFSGLKNHLEAAVDPKGRTLLMGDFNVAPESIDCFDPDGWKESLLVSTPERNLYQSIIDLGFHDCFREFHKTDHGFTFWDYRNLAFQMNRGLRIDHILASPETLGKIKKCYVAKGHRKVFKAKQKPSDHAPVVIDILKSAL